MQGLRLLAQLLGVEEMLASSIESWCGADENTQKCFKVMDKTKGEDEQTRTCPKSG